MVSDELKAQIEHENYVILKNRLEGHLGRIRNLEAHVFGKTDIPVDSVQPAPDPDELVECPWCHGRGDSRQENNKGWTCSQCDGEHEVPRSVAELHPDHESPTPLRPIDNRIGPNFGKELPALDEAIQEMLDERDAVDWAGDSIEAAVQALVFAIENSKAPHQIIGKNGPTHRRLRHALKLASPADRAVVVTKDMAEAGARALCPSIYPHDSYDEAVDIVQEEARQLAVNVIFAALRAAPAGADTDGEG